MARLALRPLARPGDLAARLRGRAFHLGAGRADLSLLAWSQTAWLRPDYFPAWAPTIRFGLTKKFKPKLPTIIEILRRVARKHDVPLESLAQAGKGVGKLSAARQEAMWALSWELGLSSVRIGRILHRDHKTVLHGIRLHTERMARLSGAGYPPYR